MIKSFLTFNKAVSFTILVLKCGIVKETFNCFLSNFSYQSEVQKLYNVSCFSFPGMSSLRSSYWHQPILSCATMNAAVLALRTMRTITTGSEQALQLLRCVCKPFKTEQKARGWGWHKSVERRDIKFAGVHSARIRQLTLEGSRPEVCLVSKHWSLGDLRKSSLRHCFFLMIGMCNSFPT